MNKSKQNFADKEQKNEIEKDSKIQDYSLLHLDLKDWMRHKDNLSKKKVIVIYGNSTSVISIK